MVDNVDICDVFDKIVLAENSYKEDGFSAGLEQGCASGYEDGYRSGAIQGAKLACEMGFYEGMALAWKQHLEAESDKNKRKLKALDSLLEAVHHVAAYDPSDIHLSEHIEVARTRFKQVKKQGIHSQICRNYFSALYSHLRHCKEFNFAASVIKVFRFDQVSSLLNVKSSYNEEKRSLMF